LTEQQLFKRLKTGDKHAFTVLFNTWKDKLHGFLLGITRSEEKADDLLQDIFLKLWNNRENLPEIDNFDAYLYTMAKNIAFDSLRRFAKTTLIFDNLFRDIDNTENITPENIFIHKELDEKIREAVKQLPPQQQKIFVMYKQEGLHHDEIAKKLNLSVSTSKNTLRNAIANLREILLKEYPELLLMIICLFDRLL
jgi:RNA polymerase sigma-70 factor (ECF subfamily)